LHCTTVGQFEAKKGEDVVAALQKMKAVKVVYEGV
jgi:hypothetical protein